MKMRCPKCMYVLAEDTDRPKEVLVDVDAGPMSAEAHLLGLMVIHYGEEVEPGRFVAELPTNLYGAVKGIAVYPRRCDEAGGSAQLAATTVMPLHRSISYEVMPRGPVQ